MAEAPPQAIVRSLVPARIDRLPWSRFHTRMIIALGVAWVLDGLEIQIASIIGPVLQHANTLHLTSQDVGFSATIYLIGEVVGALVFGRLSDRFGRRKLFVATLGLYLVANGLTAFSFNYGIFLFFRFVAGMGIGGEYAAIHSAIDELIPAKYRGRVDLAVSGTYWFGAILGSLSEYVLLNHSVFSDNLGWRVGFFIGPVLGLAIWTLRRTLPESPRWQLSHGHADEAEATIAQIEREVAASGKELAPVDEAKTLEIRPQESVSFLQVAKTLFKEYPTRSLLGATLMISQSFLYNAIFFTYGLVLTHFYGVSESGVATYFFAFAAGNLLGPLFLGRLFDTIGRKQMIASTYIVSGALLAFSGYLFKIGALTAMSQTVLWTVIFFIASAAASSGYLTVSEIFPMELRSQAIAIFFAIAQLFGALGPTVFGSLIGDQDHPNPGRLFIAYLISAGIMIVAGVIAAIFGVKAEGASLEDIAAPLSSIRSAAGSVSEKLEPGTGSSTVPSVT
ncbi:MFS transporter [Actinoallomurus iriomotensis]|uniref:MFS transporter n=1 Tax=Actinoallomurus iriomotensis TaxID=478107 RepID=A0A9W6S751_9ACTN|nr:MFS transporter [Actinoallomurus iriomotensis]GLY80423.1 MFS transporter [Actinoallomurus iriomotensis]GLY86680.1 MFS transporter [Actinoallomurus iriomotensis]